MVEDDEVEAGEAVIGTAGVVSVESPSLEDDEAEDGEVEIGTVGVGSVESPSLEGPSAMPNNPESALSKNLCVT